MRYLNPGGTTIDARCVSTGSGLAEVEGSLGDNEWALYPGFEKKTSPTTA